MARLENEEDDHRLAHLRVLSEMALSAPQVLEERATGVLRTINEDILAKESPTSEVSNICDRLESISATVVQ